MISDNLLDPTNFMWPPNFSQFYKTSRMNRHKKIPRVSFVVELWTRASNLDRIEEVPKTQHGRVTILRSELQEFRRGRITNWIQAVVNTQGIKEAFSMGSQNHKPPRPNSWWDHQLPAVMQFQKPWDSIKVNSFIYRSLCRPYYLCITVCFHAWELKLIMMPTLALPLPWAM